MLCYYVRESCNVLAVLVLLVSISSVCSIVMPTVKSPGRDIRCCAALCAYDAFFGCFVLPNYYHSVWYALFLHSTNHLVAICADEEYGADQGGEELDYGEAQAEYHEDETFAYDEGDVEAYNEQAIGGTCTGWVLEAVGATGFFGNMCQFSPVHIDGVEKVMKFRQEDLRGSAASYVPLLTSSLVIVIVYMVCAHVARLCITHPAAMI